MLAITPHSLQKSLRWLRRILTIILILANFATVMLAGAAPAHPDTQPTFPIRAAFYYPWFPEAWDQRGINPYTNYNPSLGFYDGNSQTVIQQHIAAMQYGGIQAGIASWWGQGSDTDAKMPALLQAAAGTNFRWSIYHENESLGNPSVAQLNSDLIYLRDRYGNDPSFLRVNGRFVVFVYADGGDNCAMADRWKQANTVGAYVVLKVFAGYRTCASQPDSWHQYSPAAAADSQQGYSYAIAPGFWQKGLSVRLARDLNRWNQNVKDMVASGAPWQLIATFNEWGEGTSVESAQEWASASGYGAYLDALHNNGGQTPPPTIPPTTIPPTAIPPTQTTQPTATSLPPTIPPAATATNTPITNPLPVGGNRVLNPGFETASSGATDAANWTEGANHTRASDKFNTGGWSLHSTFRGAGTDTRTSAPIAVTPNTTYTYSGYIWRTNATGAACMDMADLVGERQLCTAVTGRWQYLTGTWNSGSNTSVTLRLITDGSPTGDIWFDDISLIGPGGPTPTSVPPTQTTALPSPTRTSVPPSPTRTAVPSGDPVIAAAGDIGCDPNVPAFNGGYGTTGECRQMQVSDLLVNGGYAVVLTLGDNSNADGSLYVYERSYDPTWGRVKSITRPVAGNHDYLNAPGADGYFTYFGAAAGERGKGYYSFNVGAWHIIALNSNCSPAGGCAAGSPQETWLRADLAANQNMCTLVYWHHPKFSSGEHGNRSDLDVFWNDLYAAGVEIVLNGHDHIYERFNPQNPSGAADPKGIQEFLVGTGGKVINGLGTVKPNSAVRRTDTFGVLKLTLHPTSYDWQFVPEAGKTFTDTGTRNCFTPSSLPPTVVPTTPAPATPTSSGSSSTLTFNPAADAYVSASAPTTNYGTAPQIRVDASPVLNSYLNFNVQGINTSVASAKLRIYANTASGAGIKVFGVSNTSWAENSITFSNAPALGSPGGSTGGFAAGVWITVDITPLITGNGTFSVAITGINGTAISLASRESGANAPQLIVTTR
jgi:hypothetical protein